MKLKLSQSLIQSLLPSEPDGYLGYSVAQKSHMWWTVHLLHPPYTYKEGVRTIWGYVKNNGAVHPPAPGKKPGPKPIAKLVELFKQNPYTLIVPKDTGVRLLDLI